MAGGQAWLALFGLSSETSLAVRWLNGSAASLSFTQRSEAGPRTDPNSEADGTPEERWVSEAEAGDGVASRLSFTMLDCECLSKVPPNALAGVETLSFWFWPSILNLFTLEGIRLLRVEFCGFTLAVAEIGFGTRLGLWKKL
ncbi:hypothetical protein IE53DRAFT_361740 [Violaceomyces palustris]|uniref:Uncharacterized protein n=1 Tax=Violaceomyces palustris TaxID=1673888 RepID=A0ACD0NZH7_9BASI|nr:hypothetical protein IE53DRAFT_361740 [Violaceomyces palustris]